MTTNMLDQRLFNLRCGHHVVLGRLANKISGPAKIATKKTDLAAEPYKAALERDLDTAMQIDLQAKDRGEMDWTMSGGSAGSGARPTWKRLNLRWRARHRSGKPRPDA